MRLDELKFESRGHVTRRARLYLGDGRRLYIYQYREGRRYDLAFEDLFDIYLNRGAKAGKAEHSWQRVEPLVAQAVLCEVLETHRTDRSVWRRAIGAVRDYFGGNK